MLVDDNTKNQPSHCQRSDWLLQSLTAVSGTIQTTIFCAHVPIDSLLVVFNTVEVEIVCEHGEYPMPSQTKQENQVRVVDDEEGDILVYKFGITIKKNL